MRFDPDTLAFHGSAMRLAGLAPLLNGDTPAAAEPRVAAAGNGWRIEWRFSGGATFEMDITPRVLPGDARGLELRCRIKGVSHGLEVDSFGFRVGETDG